MSHRNTTPPQSIPNKMLTYIRLLITIFILSIYLDNYWLIIIEILKIKTIYWNVLLFWYMMVIIMMTSKPQLKIYGHIYFVYFVEKLIRPYIRIYFGDGVNCKNSVLIEIKNTYWASILIDEGEKKRWSPNTQVFVLYSTKYETLVATVIYTDTYNKHEHYLSKF